MATPRKDGGVRALLTIAQPPARTTHLGHLVTVEVQGEARTVIVQVAGAWRAGGAGQQGLLRSTLPQGCTWRLQALAWSLLPAVLPRWAQDTQGVGPAGQQARLLPTPHLGQACTWRNRCECMQVRTHRHTGTVSRAKVRVSKSQGCALSYHPGLPE